MQNLTGWKWKTTWYFYYHFRDAIPYNEWLGEFIRYAGHEDFSEDTYRTLTAVDSCLMVIDSAKGLRNVPLN